MVAKRDASGNDGAQGGLDLGDVARIVRGPDDCVVLIAERGGRWRQMAAPTVSELVEGEQPMLPEVLAALARDSYYGINGRDLLVRGKAGHGGQQHVASLAALWIDFDAHRRGHTFIDVRAGVMAAVAERLLPEVSMLADSGRGGWAFWMLRDESDPDLPAPRTIANKNLWVRCANELVRRASERLAHLVPDVAVSRDVARISRIPGSINSKSESRVAYLWQSDRRGEPIGYTLAEMAAQLGIALDEPERARKAFRVIGEPDGIGEAPPPRQRSRAELALVPTSAQQPTSEQARNGREGARMRWDQRAEAIIALGTMRGGYAEGHRHRALLYLALTSRLACWPVDDARFRLSLLAEGFRPRINPATDDGEREDVAIAGAMRQAGRGRAREGGAWLSDATIVRGLDVSRAELVELQMRSLRLAPVTSRELRRRVLADERERLLREAHREPSVRELVERLRLRGIDASLGAVHADVAALWPSRARQRNAAATPSGRAQQPLPLV